MKKATSSVREYVNRISGDDVKFLHSRLTDGYRDDLYEALDRISKDSAMDRLLTAAGSSEELFDYLDMVQTEVTAACKAGNF